MSSESDSVWAAVLNALWKPVAYAGTLVGSITVSHIHAALGIVTTLAVLVLTVLNIIKVRRELRGKKE